MRVSLILFGLGRVGRAFLRQLLNNREALKQRLNLDLVVVGLANRRCALWHRDGLDDGRLRSLFEGAEPEQVLLDQGGELKADNRSLLDALWPDLAEAPVIVDATASDEITGDLLYALQQGCGLAMANSRALVGPWSVSHHFFQDPNVRFEATVGAGLPVTRTLRDLLETGDRASAIEGSLSGTVGYICSQLQLDVPFSVTLAQARELGYTEPDPREDLTGHDSARKILVMGRLAGWPLELRDVQVERLCSPELVDLSLDRFMDQVSQLDDNMARRVQVARQEGRVLRYVAEIEAGGGRVGLRAVPKSSQLGVLQGPECLLTLFTSRYTVSPITISGRGVGTELAASVLLSDVVSLARSNLSRSPAR